MNYCNALLAIFVNCALETSTMMMIMIYKVKLYELSDMTVRFGHYSGAGDKMKYRSVINVVRWICTQRK